MSASLIAVIALGAFLVLAGMAALLVVIGSARINGPDTDQRDPYDELAVAHAAGVVRSAEPADSGLAGEVEGWLRDLTPEPPPIVPGRDTTP